MTNLFGKYSRFVTIFLLITSMLIGYGGYSFYTKLQGTHETTSYMRANTFLDTLVKFAEVHIMSFEWEMMENHIEENIKLPDIIAIKIEDFVSGKTFGSGNHANENRHHFYSTKVKHENKVIGQVMLVMDESLLLETTNWLRWFISFITVSLILGLFSIAVIFVRSKDHAEQLFHQANFDSLTGLANRVLASDRLEQALKQARRTYNKIGLMFIDLDHFKEINDTLGHDVGDKLLIQAAQRLEQCVRETDSVHRNVEGTVARLGGDEFTIILSNLRNGIDAEQVADRIMSEINDKPFYIDGHELRVGTSIGITVFPDDADDSKTLMKNADVAMYSVKENGRSGYRFFKEEIQNESNARHSMEQDLKKALERQEFEVFYQPLFDSKTRLLRGAEALMRWNSPSRGYVSPGEFIPIAEDTGMIVELGEWILTEAAKKVKEWNDGRVNPLYVSVNVSSIQFQKSNLKEVVSDIIDQTGVDPSWLKLEITESVLMFDSDDVRQTMKDIAEMGVKFYIDDFGTGYASLSYLRKFPFESLKIDRSFIDGIPDDENDAILVKSIIAMATSLNLSVVAEGIETEDQCQFISNTDCNVSQGFGLGKPTAADGFNIYLAENEPPFQCRSCTCAC